jgi:hypothetical protein
MLIVTGQQVVTLSQHPENGILKPELPVVADGGAER